MDTNSNLRQLVANTSLTERAEILGDLLTFPLALPSFVAYARSVPTVPLEFCIYNSDFEVLLFPRPTDDPIEEFRGAWYVTGGVQLTGLTTLDVWKRLSTGPKYGLSGAHFHSFQEIGTQDTQMGPGSEGKCPRGQERNVVHMVQYLGGPVGKGKWFNLDNLPSNTMGHHRRYLQEIVRLWVYTRSLV